MSPQVLIFQTLLFFSAGCTTPSVQTLAHQPVLSKAYDSRPVRITVSRSIVDRRASIQKSATYAFTPFIVSANSKWQNESGTPDIPPSSRNRHLFIHCNWTAYQWGDCTLAPYGFSDIPDLLAEYLKSSSLVETASLADNLNRISLENTDYLLEVKLDEWSRQETVYTYGISVFTYLMYAFGFPVVRESFSYDFTLKLHAPDESKMLWEKRYNGTVIAPLEGYPWLSWMYGETRNGNFACQELLPQIKSAMNDFMGGVDSKLPPSSDRNFYLQLAGKRKTETAPQVSPQRKEAMIPKQVPHAQKFAVVIGISRYDKNKGDGLSNLPFADNDANAVKASLLKTGWDENHIRLLANEEATEKNIKIALESWLTKAGPEDLIVIYWAGHGYPDPDDPEKVYFACYDTDINIPASGYRMDRVRNAIEERKAKNVILMADTCHAGKIIVRGSERGISVQPYVENLQKSQKIPKGWIFMVGADSDRTAVEHSSWKNGAFTHCLLKGLSGEADGFESSGAKDGVVTMGELKTYMNSTMPEETHKVLGVAKHPVITTNTGDPDIWNISIQNK